MLNEIPLWITLGVFILILTGALETGVRLGRHTDPIRLKGGQIVTLQAAILGLLALVLSFTYSFVANRLESRKIAVIYEANAIGTAYLRSDFASEPQRSKLRALLEQYARSRLVTQQNTDTEEGVRQVVAYSLSIQKQLWPLVRDDMQQSQAGPKQALLAQAINEVIDMHTVRLTAAFDRLPAVVFIMMLLIGGLAMFITGYVSGTTETTSRWPSSVFAVVLAFMMYVIVDMDRSLTGFVQVSQEPLHDLIVSIQGQAAALPSCFLDWTRLTSGLPDGNHGAGKPVRYHRINEV